MLLAQLKLKLQEGSTSIINNSVFIIDPRNKKLGIRVYHQKSDILPKKYLK